MKTWIVLVALAVAMTASAEDKPKPDAIDPEAYKSAMERLREKTVVAQVEEMDRLRNENAALKRRVAELEAMIGNDAIPQTAKRTFTSVRAALATLKLPDAGTPWTGAQAQRAREVAGAALIGATMEMTLPLYSASAAKNGELACVFSGKESVSAVFDGRHTDAVTSWKRGQLVHFRGTISQVDVYQVDAKPMLSVQLADCVPIAK